MTALPFPSYSHASVELAIVSQLDKPNFSWSLRVPIQDRDIANSSFIVEKPDGTDRSSSAGNRAGVVNLIIPVRPACSLTRTTRTKHFVVGFPGYDVNADIETLIRDYYVGCVSRYHRLLWLLTTCLPNRNVIIMRRNVQSTPTILFLSSEAGPSSVYTTRREANPLTFTQVTTDSHGRRPRTPSYDWN